MYKVVSCEAEVRCSMFAPGDCSSALIDAAGSTDCAGAACTANDEAISCKAISCDMINGCASAGSILPSCQITCTLPTDTSDYNTNGCDTTLDTIAALVCNPHDALEYAGAAIATCPTLGEFAMPSCKGSYGVSVARSLAVLADQPPYPPEGVPGVVRRDDTVQYMVFMSADQHHPDQPLQPPRGVAGLVGRNEVAQYVTPRRQCANYSDRIPAGYNSDIATGIVAISGFSPSGVTCATDKPTTQ